jgi:thiol-disulfide isomerase/thioredoxin
MTSTKALIGLMLAGTAGIIIFLFVHLSGDDGQSITIGRSKAAACTKPNNHTECLPEVDYVDTAGVAYSKASLDRKVVVVNFWATWCTPCLKEIPDLSRAYAKYKDRGLVILGVMTDNPDPQTFTRFQQQTGLAYPVVRANGDVMASYQYPSALPTTFIYDRGGKRVHSHVGPLREDQLARILEPLLAQE